MLIFASCPMHFVGKIKWCCSTKAIRLVIVSCVFLKPVCMLTASRVSCVRSITGLLCYGTKLTLTMLSMVCHLFLILTEIKLPFYKIWVFQSFKVKFGLHLQKKYFWFPEIIKKQGEGVPDLVHVMRTLATESIPNLPPGGELASKWVHISVNVFLLLLLFKSKLNC